LTDKERGAALEALDEVREEGRDSEGEGGSREGERGRERQREREGGRGREREREGRRGTS
jgi:hypothetical protein